MKTDLARSREPWRSRVVLAVGLALFAGCATRASGTTDGKSEPPPKTDVEGGHGKDDAVADAPSQDRPEFRLPDTAISCEGSTCGGQNPCCTDERTCGVRVPTDIFVKACIASQNRGGMLNIECPDSPTYCKQNRCQRFLGCKQASGACGYWVGSVEIVGGEEIIEQPLNLGCVQPALFRNP